MRLARLIILGLAAVCAFGVMSTGTALAGLLAHWLVNGKLITGTEHVAFKFTSGLGRLYTVEAGLILHCTSDKGEGTLLPGNLDRVSKAEFEGCQAFSVKLNGSGQLVEEKLLCTVPTVKLRPLVSLLGYLLGTERLANRFAPESGKEFTTVTFASTCAPLVFAGKEEPITGQAVGLFSSADENSEHVTGPQIFEVTNANMLVTQHPESWALEANESSGGSGAVTTQLQLASDVAAFESTETVELNSKEPFGPLK
jgi:hypothetical protein